MADCCDSCSNVVLPVGETGPQGPQGNPGTNGTNGTSIIYNYPAEDGVSSYSNTTTSAETLISESLVANTFNAVGEAIQIEFAVYNSSGTSSIDIEFDGTGIFPVVLDSSVNYLRGTILISRMNSNTAVFQFDWKATSFGGGGVGNYSQSFAIVTPFTQTGIDFTSTIDLEFTVTGSVIGNTILTKFLVLKLK